MNPSPIKEEAVAELASLIQDPSKTKQTLAIIARLEMEAYEKGYQSAQDEMSKLRNAALNEEHRETPLVMVIDDNKPLLNMLEQVLQTGGYQVITGTSGEICLTLLKTNKPDVLILDINLQDSDGETLSDYLHQQYDTRFLPIIFVSGLITPPEAKELNKSEESRKRHKRFLPKPFEISDLFNTIKEVRQAQRIAGELPWTPPLPKEIHFEAIPVRATREYPGAYKEAKLMNLKERIDQYMEEGYIPASFEYIIIELLSRGKVRVEMDGFTERLALEDIEQHMITAFASELFNRYYPQHAVPAYMLDRPTAVVPANKDLFVRTQSVVIHSKKA